LRRGQQLCGHRNGHVFPERGWVLDAHQEGPGAAGFEIFQESAAAEVIAARSAPARNPKLLRFAGSDPRNRHAPSGVHPASARLTSGTPLACRLTDGPPQLRRVPPSEGYCGASTHTSLCLMRSMSFCGSNFT
jgi:hypothetical protein